MILGRGSSTESFPLFGYDLADYETLFEEKTALFAELLEGRPVTWHGTDPRRAVRRRRRAPSRTWSVSRMARCGWQSGVGGARARVTGSR